MIFWRTHYAWSVEYDRWDPNHYSGEKWVWQFNHFGDYDTAMDEWDRITALPPGCVRNIRLNRRPVGAPMNWLRSQ